MGPGEGFAVPGLDTDPDPPPNVGVESPLRLVVDPAVALSSGNLRCLRSAPGLFRRDDPRECECDLGGRAWSSAACISAAGIGTHLFFFPDPLGTADDSSALSSLPFTDEERVLPPLAVLLLFHGGLFRASASAGKSFDALSNRLPLPCPLTPRATGCAFPGPGEPSFVERKAGKLGFGCSRDAQMFLAGLTDWKDMAPFILGVWLSRFEALEKVLALVIVDGVLGEESHEFGFAGIMSTDADVAESAETIK